MIFSRVSPMTMVWSAAKIELAGSPITSLETIGSSQNLRSRAGAGGGLLHRRVDRLLGHRLGHLDQRSTTLPVGTGRRIEMPVSLPFRAGITSPTALAWPVLVGMMFSAAARQR